MSPEEKEKIKKLVRELSQAVNSALVDSSDVKDALSKIEDEEYQVDLLFALFTRILRKKEKDEPLQLEGPTAPSKESDDQFLKGLGLVWPSD